MRRYGNLKERRINMKLSQTGMGTVKLNNIDEMYPGQSILLQTGQLVQYGAGLFGYNTVPLLVRRKVEQIIVETLNKYGCMEVLLPTLQPDTLWKNSGRYDHYVKDGTMLITESNKGTFCLAPTGEEAMLEFLREKLKSYKNLPVTYYQIGEKYRNEIRTRGYLLRGKSFPMLDAYSFDMNEEGMAKSYENIRNAFLEIFEKIGMKVIPIVADNGAMGGKKSEEFMLISEQGEDKILYDEKAGIGLNTEILEKENYEQYLEDEYGIKDISNFKEIRTMELGHIFQLGTRYSEMMNGKYTDKDGKEALYYMGCYGIGVSRTVAALYEQCLINDSKWGPCGFSLPEQIAPYKVQIVPKMDNEEKVKMASELYLKLQQEGIDSILDDRENLNIGAKIKDCKVLGTPYLVVLGDKTEGENLELENTKTGEKQVVTMKELIKKFKEI
jgi:prolyl-tRNA synthetase